MIGHLKSTKIALVAAIAMTGTGLALAQANWEPPTTSWGVPDVQGMWDYSNRTSMERHPRFEGQLIISSARMMELVPSFEEYAEALEAVGAEAPGPQNVGGYNSFWIDYRDWLGTVEGEYRTSFIIQPETGQIPWKEGGREARAAQRARLSYSHMQRDAGPEGFPLSERCLISFSSVVPFTPSLYNNNMQIVQSPTHVMILAEMVNDARIVRIDADFPQNMQPLWHGNSIGYYEDNDLVVVTKGFHPLQVSRGGAYTSENALITERFRRTGDGVLRYIFTIEDPDLYSEPWTGEMEMRPSEAMYEYACHEGNYAMPGALAGSRTFEYIEEFGREPPMARPVTSQ
jgi:hypothetical protein